MFEDETTPMVAIDGGHILLGGSWNESRYLIDRTAQTCWFLAGTSLAPLDCCALARVPAAQPYLPWTTSCEATAAAPITEPSSVPPAAPPVIAPPAP